MTTSKTRTLYWKILQLFGLLERRCGWCKKWLGWKRSRGVKYATPISHGICEPCLVKFEAEQDATAEQRQQVRPPYRRQRPSRRTMRRRTGGWSGAVAVMYG